MLLNKKKQTITQALRLVLHSCTRHSICCCHLQTATLQLNLELSMDKSETILKEQCSNGCIYSAFIQCILQSPSHSYTLWMVVNHTGPNHQEQFGVQLLAWRTFWHPAEDGTTDSVMNGQPATTEADSQLSLTYSHISNVSKGGTWVLAGRHQITPRSRGQAYEWSFIKKKDKKTLALVCFQK